MRIIAMPNAHALAHVSRLLEISKQLKQKGHEIIFAGTGKYLEVAAQDNFPTYELPYISIQQIINAVRTQKLNQLYQASQLEGFIEAEIALYNKIKPDLVMIDNRPTARTSADKYGLMTVAVLNVHMSSYRKIPFFSLSDKTAAANSKLFSLLDRIENNIEYFFYQHMVMCDLNKLRRQMKLKPYYANQHEEGDLSLLADIPEFNPAAQPLPAQVQFVGPLTWHNQLPAPACLKSLDKHRKTVYFSLGSESLDELIEQLGALTGLGSVQVVVACGKTDKIPKSPSPHVYLEEYVNTDKLLAECDAVCCHGGNGTLYQALSFGLPIVAVSTHAEQRIGARRIQQLGLGRALTLKQVKSKGIAFLVQTVEQVLADDKMRNKARQFAKKIHQWQGPTAAVEAIERFIHTQKQVKKY